MRLFISIFCFIIFCVSSTAQRQEPHISITETEHDFDTINEVDGKVVYSFHFVNMGSAPLEIINVRSSCGCTAPDWSRDPIPAGGRGFVSVAYDPTGRPGRFSQMVAVNTNDEEQPVVKLTIKGFVIARPLSIEEKYPRKMEDIRLQSNHLAFGRVYKDEVSEGVLAFANASSKPVRVTFDHVPEHIRLWSEPELVEPRQEAVIKGTYDGSAVDDWGFVIARVSIEINGEASARTRLTVSADINENFDAWAKKQKANAPKIVFDKEGANLGAVKTEQDVPFVFQFTNEGKSDLIIRKVSSSCGCTVAKPDKKIISPGESSAFNGIFSTGKRKGRQNMVITIITNDPSQSIKRLYVQAVVE